MQLSNRVLELPRTAKRAVALVVDILLCLITVGAAFALRLDHWVIPQGLQYLAYIGTIVIALPIFISFGLYRAIFRFAGKGALVSVFRACALYGLIYATVFTGIGVQGIPRTIGLIQPILLFVAIGASRFFVHYMLGGGYQELLRQGSRRRVLIYGAGSAGRQLAAALASSHDMFLVGFADDDPHLQGNLLNGKRIYAGAKLPDLIRKLEVDDLLLAVPSATRKRRAEIIEGLRGVVVSIRTVPGLMDIAHGRIKMQDLRELDIVDLLGRETVPPSQILLSRNIVGKVVLVTGAGGSIGSELCRQIIELRPKKLILVENSEYNLYAIEQDLIARNDDGLGGCLTKIIIALASVQDADRMAIVFEQWRPDTVYHAAAYKHVPIVEANPAEGVCNNVRGTLIVARQAITSRTSNFVLISTDKAVRPTNVMGTSKRLAELVLQAHAAQPTQTRFSMVRFGNVLGSSGSVVPLFRQQIRAGGPVTLTHKDITRYFMTIPEAALLVIQAGAMAKGGEVFVLDMGEPVKIFDLAQRMIELSGLRVQDDSCPDGDIAITCVGLRPGEKLYEELLIGNNAEPTTHPRIMMARESFIPLTQLELELDMLFAHAKNGDSQAVIDDLCRLVPEAQNLLDNSNILDRRLQAS
jgi:FlaA1/EpsC-like NDP-sugar epimerase